MNFILGWLGTILASQMIKVGTILTMIKDVADGGALLDTSSTSKMQDFVSDNDDENVTGATVLMDFVPVANILNSMQLYTQYMQNRESILKSLDYVGVFKEMDESTLKEYNSDPTMLNILKIYFNKIKESKEAYENKELQYTAEKVHHDLIIKDYINYFKDFELAEEEYEKDKQFRLKSDDPDLEEKLKNVNVIKLSAGSIYYIIEDNKPIFSLSDFRVIYTDGAFDFGEVTFNERNYGFILATSLNKEVDYNRRISGYSTDTSKRYIKVRK